MQKQAGNKCEFLTPPFQSDEKKAVHRFVFPPLAISHIVLFVLMLLSFLNRGNGEK